MSQIDLGSELLNFIVQNGYSTGDRLPTIQELKADDKLGISTSKIREQLEVARAVGLVDVRSKKGTHIKPYSFAPAVRLSLMIALAIDPSTFHQFSELRSHIEAAFWHEACELIDEADKVTMRRCITEARAKLTSDWIRIPHAEHRIFHLTMFKKLDNPFVTGLLEAYWDAYDAVQPSSYAPYAYLQLVWDYHERILDAICVGDYDGALEAFIEHTQLPSRREDGSASTP
ncbi:MAG: hypothetical protein Kow00117_16690 [Phototrophicales bacterium]